MKLKTAFICKKHLENYILRNLNEKIQLFKKLPYSIKREAIKNEIEEISKDLKDNSHILKEIIDLDDINICFSTSEVDLIIDEAIKYVYLKVIELSS